MSPESIIYGARCLRDGRWYIGKTDRPLQERIREHEYAASTNSPELFHKTMRDMGLRNFEWKELGRYPRGEILEQERRIIRELSAQSIEVLNTTHTSERSKRTRDKQRSALGGRLGAAHAWRKKTARQWMQRSGKLLPCICLETGEKFGSLLEAERKCHKRKGHDSRPGIKKSCETGLPTLDGRRYAYLDIDGNPMLTKGHQKSVSRTRGVMNLSTGARFENAAAAAKACGQSEMSIRSCCAGKYMTAGGMVFCYLDADGHEILTESHHRNRAETELRQRRGFAAWRIEDVDRKRLWTADTTDDLAKLIGISRTHMISICQGKRQHDNGWRVAFYDKANNKIDLTEAHSAVIRKQLRSVVCLDGNRIYRGPTEAAKHYGLMRSQVQACCQGQIKSTGGEDRRTKRYRFAFLDSDGTPILTPKHRQALVWSGETTLFCPQTNATYESVAHCSRETAIPQKRIRRYLEDPTIDLGGITLVPISSSKSQRGMTDGVPESGG